MTKRKLIRKKTTKYSRGGLKRKYQAGGSQYDGNTTSAAGQGNPSTTIINTESNPEVLAQREEQLQTLQQNQVDNQARVAEEIAQVNQEGEQNIQDAATNAGAQGEAYASGVSTTAKTLKEAQPDAFEKMGDKLDKFGQKIANKRMVSKLLRKTDKGIKAAKALQKTDVVAGMAAKEQSTRFAAQLKSGTLPKMSSTLKMPDLKTTISGMQPKGNALTLGANKSKFALESSDFTKSVMGGGNPMKDGLMASKNNC